MEDSIDTDPPVALASPPPAVTPATIAGGLLYTDYYWAAGQFTYSVPTASSTWAGYDPGSEPLSPNHFTALNATQAARFVDAIAQWDRLIAPNFVQTNDATAPGNIRVGFTDIAGIKADWGYAAAPNYHGGSGPAYAGDVWINADYAASTFQPGGYDFEGLLHELGHAIGLKHPFEAPSIPAEYDNRRYTVMSYTDPAGRYAVTINPLANGSIQGAYTAVDASTPMVLDIAAVQARYGADPTTDAGNSTYTFTPGQQFLKAIYDAGGIDTLDMSALTRGSDVDLTPGAYSSIGLYSVADQIADWTARYPWAADYVQSLFANVSAYTGKDNLGIAFSTTIENAVGGSGNDTLTGNTANNGLYGGNGADYIRGLDGNDVIDGGAGNDDVNGNQGLDIVHGGDGADSVRGGQGNDTVYGDAGDDPHVNGNIGDDLVYGGTGNDTVFGGQGNDTLYGEDGNDWLSGDLGNDVMTGGLGADRFLFRVGSGADVVTDFSSAQGDRVQLAAGTAYTLVTVGGQVVVDLGGGDQLTLSVVTTATLGDWLVFA